MVNRGYVSLTTTALVGIVYIRRVHLDGYLLGPLGFGSLRSLYGLTSSRSVFAEIVRETKTMYFEVYATKTVTKQHIQHICKRPHNEKKVAETAPGCKVLVETAPE